MIKYFFYGGIDMKAERKIALFNNLFNFIAQNNENSTEVLYHLGMTQNEIDDCAGVEYREDDDEEYVD